jgi:benzylsuccinate CoA-transferase BbsE subunit
MRAYYNIPGNRKITAMPSGVLHVVETVRFKKYSQEEHMLSCYRIIDLTTDKAFICGRALSDFGANVIKVEKPGGDPSRFVPPFYKNEPDPEKNLWWLSFNTNKKGITLDIETPEGREVFKKLVAKADAVLESCAPGYMDSLGLGYRDLAEVNPGIVLTSITGFGQAGPYRDYKDPDIVVRALGGLVHSVGYDDRPPLVSSFRHTHSLAAMNGAAGTMIALMHRTITGKGQHVDASAQQAIDVVCSAEIEGPYSLFGKVVTRHGRARAEVTLADGSTYYNTLIWECKDGYIALNLLLNPSGAKNNETMFSYIENEGIPTGTFKDWDWKTRSWEDMTREQADEMMVILGKFFTNHTKQELLDMAVENRFQLGPCNNAQDILKHPQLQARGYWQEIEHPELGASLKFPGGAVMTTNGYVGPKHRAPRIGEHNDEIYREIGLSPADIESLSKKKVI